MTKDVRRALLIARRMFAYGGDTATTTVTPGDSAFSGFFGGKANKSGEATVAKPADKLPLQEPLPATTVNYQNLSPPGMGMITPASAPGGGLPNVPGFMAGPSGFGSLVPAQASLTSPFSGVTGAPNLGAPTPSVGASGSFNPSLAQATFNYAPAAAVPKLIEPTTNPFAPSATTTADAAAKNVYEPIEGSGTTSESDGPGDSGDATAFASGGHVGHAQVMDPHDLPGIHVRTAHTFAAGGTADNPDEGEGFDAYHGSPHAFEKFDPSKIGTGEGAQAYGHGMYFAENEGIARGYRDKLSMNNPSAVVIGQNKPISAGLKRSIIDQFRSIGASNDAAVFIAHALDEAKGDINKAKQFFANKNSPLMQEAMALLDNVSKPPQGGHLYHVRIKANPEHFLDWDAPLSEQKHILDKIDYHVGDPEIVMQRLFSDPSKATGGDLHDAFGGKHKPDAVAQKLQQMGIPGIKYWDAGSRAQGQGTRNYVIFNPDIIHVKRRYADGGLIQDEYPTHYMPNVGRQVMRNGGAESSSGLEEYQDPESKRMAGWDWTPLPEVHKSLGSFTEIPSHVAAFGNFMNETAKKAATTGLTPRDLIKAYLITRASIQRGDLTPEKIMENWPDFPGPKDRLIRPEGAMGEWLQTPMGQKYLDAAVKGNVHQGAVQDAVRAMSSFGMTNKGEAQALPYAAKMLPGQEKLVSDMVARAIHSDSAPQEWRDWATKLHGIKYAKSGFLASMLGRGDQPTADTRQYNVHSGTPPGNERNKLIDKAQVDSVLRLAARQRALNIGMPSELTPHYQHLVHHTVWDKSADAVTTHEDLMNAMRHAASGGEINDPPIHQHIVAHAMRAAGIEGLDQHKMADGGDPGSDPMVQKAMRAARKPTQTPDAILRALALSRSITKGS